MTDHQFLSGAHDLHVHCEPDSVARAQHTWDLARAARKAGMAGIGLKDHNTSTVGRCAVLNRAFPHGPRFFSSLALNPSVGGLNPFAVEAALLAGCDIIYFPTYGARRQIEVKGRDGMPFPLPARHTGDTALDEQGNLRSETQQIIELIAAHDAVLASGHLSAAETLVLLRAARDTGVSRLLVTHASEPVPGMTVELQRECAKLGALLEHCFMACTASCAPALPIEELAKQIRAVGPGQIVLSSDFGQTPNGPPVPGFGRCLVKLHECGVSVADIRTMIVENPARLLLNRRGTL